MAALYLHNAIFANESPTPSTSHSPIASAHYRPPPPRAIHDRHLSSLSLVTLRTATTEHSHPHEPLLDDTISREVGRSTNLDFSPLEIDANSNNDIWIQQERRRRQGIELQKKLLRIRWAKRGVMILIGAWAVFNTIRYFLAYTIYRTHTRRIINLTLACVSAITAILTIFSLSLTALAALLGWKYGPRTSYHFIQSLLGYLFPILLLGPPISNVVFVIMWKSSAPEPSDIVQGRCNWDIDALWSGTGSSCDSSRAMPWAFWLAAAIVRLVLTSCVTIAYLLLSRKYALTRRPSRRRHSRSHASPSTTSPSASSSTRTTRYMTSNPNSVPATLARVSRQESQSTDQSCHTFESVGGSIPGDLHHQRTSRLPGRSHSYERGSSSQGHGNPPREAHMTTLRFADQEKQDDALSSSSSSEEDLTFVGDPDQPSRYGIPIRQTPGNYTLVSPNSPSYNHQPPPSINDHAEEPSSSTPSDPDLLNFVDRFRSLVDHATNHASNGSHSRGESGSDIDLADGDYEDYFSEPAVPSPPTTPRPASVEDREYFRFPYMGHTIQRMPTIESLGSREIASLAASSNRGDRSIHTSSRPPTRSNTLNGSRPPSRSASVALSPVEGGHGLAGTVDEREELPRMNSPTQSKSSHQSKSTATSSYHTAASNPNPMNDTFVKTDHDTIP